MNGRERIGRAVLPFFVAGTMGACSGEPQQIHKSDVQEQQMTQEILRQDMSLFYPELQKSPIKESGRLQTPRGSRVDYINTTDTHLDRQSLETMFSYFDTLAQQGGIPAAMNYRGQPIPVRLEQDTRSLNHLLFLVDAATQNPGWAGADRHDAVTDVGFPTAEVSVVHYTYDPAVTTFPTKDMYTASSIATEVCQQVVNVTASIPSFSDIAQETVCNSLGNSYEAKQTGMDYQSYVAFARHGYFPEFQTHMMILGPNDYAAIPVAGPLLKK